MNKNQKHRNNSEREHSLGLARTFLESLDEEAETFCFQIFSDEDKKKSEEKVSPIEPRVLFGSIDDLFDKLYELNKKGAGIFVAVNEITGKKRKTEHVTRIRSVFVDLDGAPLAPVLQSSLSPHLIVQSSADRFHAYWFVKDCQLDLFKPTQQELAKKFNGDSVVCDLPRVMRVPGFFHQKNPKSPFLCNIYQKDEGLPYPFDKIIAEMKLDLFQNREAQDRLKWDGKSDIHENTRNTTLFNYGCKLKRKGASPQKIEESLLSINETYCKPPLSTSEVKKAAASASKSLQIDTNNPSSITEATKMINLTQGWELFKNQRGEACTSILENGHKKTYRLKSEAIDSLLIDCFYTQFDKVPGSNALKDAIATLEAKATRKGPEIPTFNRVGEFEGNIYLDLCNERWEAVEITSTGWRVTATTPVKFIRNPGMKEIPIPVSGGRADEIGKIFNLGKDQTKMVVGFLLACINPNGPFPILTVRGEKGSGKTFLCTFIKGLVDPCIPNRRTMSKNERDLAIAVKNSWVLSFDNLSGLTNEISDALCRVSSGGGLGTRKNYTDDIESIFESQSPIILNGINTIAVRPDLRDRAIDIVTFAIHKKQREDESYLNAKLQESIPRIIGGLLDGVCSALKNKENTKLKQSPRMADFARWVTAAEEGLQWKPMSFMKAYNANSRRAIDETIDNSLLAQAIISFAKGLDKQEWVGRPTDLLQEIPFENIDSIIYRARDWPRTPSALSRELNQIIPDLREKGVLVTTGKNIKGGKRMIVIKKFHEEEEETDGTDGNHKKTSASISLIGKGDVRQVRQAGSSLSLDKKKRGEGEMDGQSAEGEQKRLPGWPEKLWYE